MHGLPIATLRIVPADTRPEIRRYFQFPRTVYRDDPWWVAPIVTDRMAKVDRDRNPFWRSADRQLWIAERGAEAVGTITAIHDRRSNEILRRRTGTFGFFECRNDPEAARLIVRPPGNHAFLEDAHPHLRRAIGIAGRRDRGVSIRKLDRRRWDADIRTACRLFNAALAYLPDHVPVGEEEFLSMASGLRPILDDDMALLAEVAGRPAGFALALPDANQALRYARGRLGLWGTLQFLRHRSGIDRASFKIMMVAPEFQDRFVEVLLLQRLGETLWRKGYREVDLSLTGDENWKSNRIQERTGALIYRRYRIYEKDLNPTEGGPA